MQENDVQGLLAFGSQAETVQWLLTAFHEQGQRIIQLEKDNAALAARINLIEENAEIQAGILARIKGDKLQPKQQSNREILLALLESRQCKMPEREARQIMGIGKQSFTNLLATLKDEVEVRQMKTDKRRKLLVLK